MINLYYHYTYAPNGGFGILGKAIQKALIEDPRFNVIGANHEFFSDEKPDIIFTYGMPNLIEDIQRDLRKKYKTRKRWFHVHYFVWESSKLPDDFVKAYKNVDLLLTSCEWSKRIASKQGLKAIVWHHGIDSRFKYRQPLNDSTFTFLHYNAYEYRKGWELVLEAFMKEFYLDEPVKLIMKARERKESVWLIPHKRLTQQDYLETKKDPDYLLKKMNIDHPLIEEVIGHVSDEEMVRITESADCFVFPAKGEGWGLPPFEAMARGIVPILPKQGCFKEWFIDETMLKVNIKGWINSEPRYPGVMFYPSVLSLRRQMRKAFNMWKDNKEQWDLMGKKGSEIIHEKYNWNKITNDLFNILSNL